MRVDGEAVGEIGQGLCVLLGVAREDGEDEAARLADKVAKLRIFENEDGRFDRSLLDVGGEALVVSQFTLIADTAKGNRPSFSERGGARRRRATLRAFCAALREPGVRVETGRLRRADGGRARERRSRHDRALGAGRRAAPRARRCRPARRAGTCARGPARRSRGYGDRLLLRGARLHSRRGRPRGRSSPRRSRTGGLRGPRAHVRRLACRRVRAGRSSASSTRSPAGSRRCSCSLVGVAALGVGTWRAKRSESSSSRQASCSCGASGAGTVGRRRARARDREPASRATRLPTRAASSTPTRSRTSCVVLALPAVSPTSRSGGDGEEPGDSGPSWGWTPVFDRARVVRRLRARAVRAAARLGRLGRRGPRDRASSSPSSSPHRFSASRSGLVGWRARHSSWPASRFLREPDVAILLTPHFEVQDEMGARRPFFLEEIQMADVYDKERTLLREITPKVEDAIPGVEVLALELSGPERFTVYIDHPQRVDHALCERVTERAAPVSPAVHRRGLVARRRAPAPHARALPAGRRTQGRAPHG